MSKSIHDIALDYFIAHQDELVAKYNGKCLLLHGAEVVGAFDSIQPGIFMDVAVSTPGLFFIG